MQRAIGAESLKPPRHAAVDSVIGNILKAVVRNAGRHVNTQVRAEAADYRAMILYAPGRIDIVLSHMNRSLCCGLFLFVGAVAVLSAAPQGVLMHAHSHNDYLHKRPLADALEHGFWSVEADIWLTNGVLLVAHDLDQATPERTLQRLYLDPLRAFAKTNVAMRGGAPPLTLLIDVKSEAEATYVALRDVLQNYSDILTRFESNRIRTNAVMVIISGNRADATMRAEPMRLAALDGRLPDLDGNPPAALVPLVSDNWTKHFMWRGTGALPPEERAKLRELVARTHAQGRRLRFWATPDDPNGWRELHEAGVDLLNTDSLTGLSVFLRAR